MLFSYTALCYSFSQHLYRKKGKLAAWATARLLHNLTQASAEIQIKTYILHK